MVEQNLTYAVLLALLGGFFQVISVLILAYPEHLKQTRYASTSKDNEIDVGGGSSTTDSIVSGAASDEESQTNRNPQKKIRQNTLMTIKVKTSTRNISPTAAAGTMETTEGSKIPKKEANSKTKKPFLLTIPRPILISINVFIQLFNGAANTGAAIYGPVAIVMPVTVSSQLLFNILIFGCLHMEEFGKDVQVGTFIVVLGAITLPVVGPTVQQNQDIMELLQAKWSLAWTSFLFAGVVISGVSCFSCVHTQRWKERSKKVYITLAVARVFSSVLNTSFSKALALVSGLQLFTVIGGFLVCGFVLGTSVVLQATKTEQKLFVPIISCLTQLVNAATGLILWEDWRVVQSWVGYAAITVQIVVGVYLISSLDFFENTADPYYGMKQSMDLRQQKHQNQNNKNDDNRKNQDENASIEINAADSIDSKPPKRYDHFDLRLRRNNLNTPDSTLDTSLHSITSIRGLIGGLKHEPSYRVRRRGMLAMKDHFEEDSNKDEEDDEVGTLCSERGKIMMQNMKFAQEAAKRGEDHFIQNVDI